MYREALPLWRGEPDLDVADGMWVHAERGVALQAVNDAAVAAYGPAPPVGGRLDRSLRTQWSAAPAVDPIEDAAYRLLA